MKFSTNPINKFLHSAEIRYSKRAPIYSRHDADIQVISLQQGFFYLNTYKSNIAPLWSSGQSLWLQIQRSRVRSPALPDFLSSSGSGTGSTQPREPREVN